MNTLVDVSISLLDNSQDIHHASHGRRCLCLHCRHWYPHEMVLCSIRGRAYPGGEPLRDGTSHRELLHPP